MESTPHPCLDISHQSSSFDLALSMEQTFLIWVRINDLDSGGCNVRSRMKLAVLDRTATDEYLHSMISLHVLNQKEL